MTTASAPGKVILVGEHAVVYGRPAIGVPVWQVVATATVTEGVHGSGLLLRAPDVHVQWRLRDAPADYPPALVARLALEVAGCPPDPDWEVEVRSTIPIAGGLGSGAALSTALVRAIFEHAGRDPMPAAVSAFVFESERHYHGTPSGIDNTVIAWGCPIWFVRGEAPRPFAPAVPLKILIADSGVPSPTKESVGDVRRGWQADQARYEQRFDILAALARAARDAIERGDLPALGAVFQDAQSVLVDLDVSSPLLDRLVAAAIGAGAFGAKLSGGGRGGNVIALVADDRIDAVRAALLAAGAQRVIETTVR